MKMRLNYLKLIVIYIAIVGAFCLFPAKVYAGDDPGTCDQVQYTVYTNVGGEPGTQIGSDNGDPTAVTVTPGQEIFVCVQLDFDNDQQKKWYPGVNWREWEGGWQDTLQIGEGDGSIWRCFDSSVYNDNDETVPAHFTATTDETYFYESSKEAQDDQGWLGTGQIEVWFALQAPDTAGQYGLAYTRSKNQGDPYPDDTMANTITNEVDITVKEPYELTQNNWRWYENTNAVDPTTPYGGAEQKEAITGVPCGEDLRIRMNISVAIGDMAADSEAFKLQYGQGTDCTAISEENWHYVGAKGSGTIWRGYENAISDPQTITTLKLIDPGGSEAKESYSEENPSPNNPNAIISGEEGEWDWVVQENGATANTTYCFRMIYSDDNPLDGYNTDSYPKLTTVTSASWLEVEDKAIPTVSPALEKNTPVRLRIEVANTSFEAENYDYRLEYASTATDCSSDPGGWGVVPVTASGEHFEMVDSTYFIDGCPTTAQLTQPDSYTFVTGKMVEDDSNSSGNITLGYEEYTEIEFVFQATTDATDGGTYCFRVTKAGTDLDNYDVYPEVTLAGVVDEPQVSSVSLNGGSPITLTVENGETTGFTVTGTVTDAQGCETISTVVASIYRTDIAWAGCDTSGETNNNYCYPLISCSVDPEGNQCTGAEDTDADYKCTFSLQYHAAPTDANTPWVDYAWNATMKATDSGALSDTGEATEVELESFLALDLDPSYNSITYGTLSPAEKNDPLLESTEIRATGNCALDAYIYGTDMKKTGCSDILVNKQKAGVYAASCPAWSDAGNITLDYSTNSQEAELNCPKTYITATLASKFLCWGIEIPSPQESGENYSGTNTIVAEKAEVGDWGAEP